MTHPDHPAPEQRAEPLSAEHQQHVHRNGCHRWFDHGANELLDLVGPAGWCDGCTEDWPCDTTRALNRATLDAARSGPASGGGLDALLRRIERHVDCECGADHRYRFMEEVRVLSGSLAATEPTDEERTDEVSRR
jgi:hypothetical protein